MPTGPVVAPWGIDHDTVDRPSPEAGPAFGDIPARFLLYVGQARPHKGIPVLVEAYRRSVAATAGVGLVCVGRDFAPDRPGARTLTAALGAGAYSLGSVDDTVLRNLYSRAAALVAISVHEGFGFPPLEALAMGCAVIAADIPVFHETLGRHAQFIDPTDPAALAAAIDGTLARGAGADAERQQRTDWAARYTWDKHIDKVLDVYEDVLKLEPGAGSSRPE